MRIRGCERRWGERDMRTLNSTDRQKDTYSSATQTQTRTDGHFQQLHTDPDRRTQPHSAAGAAPRPRLFARRWSPAAPCAHRAAPIPRHCPQVRLPAGSPPPVVHAADRDRCVSPDAVLPGVPPRHSAPAAPLHFMAPNPSSCWCCCLLKDHHPAEVASVGSAGMGHPPELQHCTGNLSVPN